MCYQKIVPLQWYIIIISQLVTFTFYTSLDFDALHLLYEVSIVLLLLFTDVDECISGTHNCSNNATCTDSDGSYLCSCKPGYDGDGYACTSKS